MYTYIYIIMYIYCICMYSPIKPIHQMYTIHCFSLVKTTKNRIESHLLAEESSTQNLGLLQLLNRFIYLLTIYRLYYIVYLWVLYTRLNSFLYYILIYYSFIGYIKHDVLFTYYQNMCKIVMYENILEHIVIYIYMVQ